MPLPARLREEGTTSSSAPTLQAPSRFLPSDRVEVEPRLVPQCHHPSPKSRRGSSHTRAATSFVAVSIAHSVCLCTLLALPIFFLRWHHLILYGETAGSDWEARYSIALSCCAGLHVSPICLSEEIAALKIWSEGLRIKSRSCRFLCPVW